MFSIHLKYNLQKTLNYRIFEIQWRYIHANSVINSSLTCSCRLSVIFVRFIILKRWWLENVWIKYLHLVWHPWANEDFASFISFMICHCIEHKRDFTWSLTDAFMKHETGLDGIILLYLSRSEYTLHPVSFIVKKRGNYIHAPNARCVGAVWTLHNLWTNSKVAVLYLMPDMMLA